VTKLCEVADVSRAGYYRFLKPAGENEEEMELRDAIQRTAIKRPTYGYRRITEQLRRDGREVGYKRVLRIMREDNLLCLNRKSFVRTTDSGHGLPVYPNLAKGLKLERLNQLWVADITYIRLLCEFVYLAVILDAFSRRVIGWALGKTLQDDLSLAALKLAISRGRVEEGLVHHSDRGSQYASGAYTGLLKEHSIQISMSRRGNPYDKAYASHCTSFVPCVMTKPAAALFDSLTPCAFRGGFSPGCS
jgi:putative transposase